MTIKETLKRLKALGTEKMRAQNSENGASDNQFGVRRGDVRALAKEIKTDHFPDHRKRALAIGETLGL